MWAHLPGLQTMQPYCASVQLVAFDQMSPFLGNIGFSSALLLTHQFCRMYTALLPSINLRILQEGTAHLIADRQSSDQEVSIMAPSVVSFGDEPSQPFSYLYTAKAIWQPAASVCSVYTITLAIFPGFLAEDVSSEQLGSWYPVLLITAFNIADVIGKTLPVQAQFAIQNRNWILNLCLARILFLPAFYVAASQGFGPGVMAVLTLALGVSNGYLTAVSMMIAPAGLQVVTTRLPLHDFKSCIWIKC